MRKLIIVFLLTLSSFSYAIQSDNKIYWDDKKISFSDMQGKADYIILYKIHLEYGMEIITTPFFLSFKKSYQSKAFINPLESWISEDDTDLIAFAQVLFDIIEIYSRKLQKELLLISGGPFEEFIVNDLKEKNIKNCEDEVNTLLQKIHRENYSHNEIEEQKVIVEKRLLEEEIHFVDKISNFSLSWHLVGGISYYSKNLNNYFSVPKNFGINLTLYYKNINLQFNLSQGYNSVTHSFTNSNGLWPINHKTKVAIPEFILGYAFRSKNYIISPFSGMAILQFTSRSFPETNLMISSNPSFCAGVEFSYILKEKDYGYYPKEKSTILLKGRLSFSPIRFENSEFNSLLFNISLGIGFILNKYKITILPFVK